MTNHPCEKEYLKNELLRQKQCPKEKEGVKFSAALEEPVWARRVSNYLRRRLNSDFMGRTPSAHAWRRGWAVQALRSGVSETSVRAAAGWSSGAMVARYTRALSGEFS